MILDTVSGEHDINTYVGLLKVDGTLILVGARENPMPVAAISTIPNLTLGKPAAYVRK